MSASHSGRRGRDSAGRFLATKAGEEAEARRREDEDEERNEEVLDESVQYASDGGPTEGHLALHPFDGGSEEPTDGELRREQPLRYNPAPTPARGLLWRRSDATSPLAEASGSMSRREILELFAEMQANIMANMG
ncbi:hypothetical protein HDU87_006875 [Geranomyces variabilis]|uniref:Uncharacterized protein n=1 Tax=Geranomyces variabilis TaxID=109894 RepID=A0AAD5TER5_9FUNG|nr:hypothetical protein HDU87_006875 [Geranomyces variabilis]